MVRQIPMSMEDNGADVLLIFQAPGVAEWQEGKPICSVHSSSAGGRLAVAFNALGRTRQDYNITNTVQCFPGKRASISGERSRDKIPPAAVRHCCSNWLRDDIEGRPYRLVVVFGREAQKAVRALGYKNDQRFRFSKHPTGGISNAELSACLG